MASSVHKTPRSGIVANTKRLQQEFSRMVVLEDSLSEEPTSICGIDVAYRNNIAYCSAVVMNKQTMSIGKRANETSVITNPYIPGFLMLRESQVLLKVLEPLKSAIDVLLIDGHGVLHPRRCGLASYVGVSLDIPTIGVAKSLLCGVITDDHLISIDGSTSGYELVRENKKPIYISVGHKLKLDTAINLVYNLIKPKERIPEPLRLADIFSKAQARCSIC